MSNLAMRPLRGAAVFAAAWLLASCGGSGADADGGGPAPPPSAGFELRLDSASIAAPADSSGLLRVRVERQGGFSGPIEIGLADAPAGISADTVMVEQADEAQLPLNIAADVAMGAVDIVIAGSSGAATTRLPLRIDVQVAQPRSQELIRQALAAGEIDLGTSLLYRAYAVFGDTKLPAAYVGSGPAEEDRALFVEVEQARPTLPQAILDLLQPYLVRPDDPQSVFNVGRPTGRERPAAADSDQCSGTTREWITRGSTLHPVRAWALCFGTPGDETAPTNLARILDVVDKAYGKMVELMGPAKADLWYDEAIDVYAVPRAADAPRQRGDYEVEQVRGVEFSQRPFVGRTSSGYVMMPTHQLARSDYQLTLIHELFHVLQDAHNYELADYWFTEASATWAGFHFNRTVPIHPAHNTERHRERFGGFQGSGDGLLSVAGTHEYFAYVWPLFMEQEQSESLIGGAWSRFDDVASHQAATAALDATLSFKDNLRRFAVRNINDEFSPGNPVDPRYKKLDPAFPEEPGLRPSRDDYGLEGNFTVTARQDIPALAARYLRFDVAADGGVNSVEFDFGNLSGREHLSVDALIRNDDGWLAQPVSLDGDPRPRFCFDLGPSTATVRGSFVELWLVLSNHALDAASVVAGTLRVRPSTAGCAGWSGEIRWSSLSDVPGVGRTDASTLASVTFAVDEDPPGGTVTGVVAYKVSSGHVRYRAEVTTPACHEIATAEVEMSPEATSGKGATVESLATFSTNGVPQYGSFSGATFGDISVTGNCTPDGTHSTVVHENRLIPWWSDPSGRPIYDLKENGTLMQEDVTVSSDQSGVRSQWTLRKIGK